MALAPDEVSPRISRIRPPIKPCSTSFVSLCSTSSPQGDDSERPPRRGFVSFTPRIGGRGSPATYRAEGISRAKHISRPQDISRGIAVNSSAPPSPSLAPRANIIERGALTSFDRLRSTSLLRQQHITARSALLAAAHVLFVISHNYSDSVCQFRRFFIAKGSFYCFLCRLGV